MQNTVYERKQNGEDFFSLLSVTCSCSGNCPANGLVTEQPQYSVAVCIFPTWQNTEISLIPNGLRLIFTSSLPLALAILFHCSSNLYSWIGGYCINIIYKVIRTAAQLHITTEVPTIIIEGTHISLECQSICLSFGCQPSLNNFPY